MTFTLHGLILIFFTLMPGLFGGFGNYFIPIYLGSPEVALPRINSISLIVVPVSYVTLLFSTLAEFGGGPGWTLYPPLSTSLMSLSPASVDLIILGIALAGISSLLSSINFLTTIFHIRLAGYPLGGNVFNTWSVMFTAFLLLFTLPILSGAVLMLLSDLHLNTQFYDPVFNGDPVLYQHLFWFFGHPEVYVLILPAFGVISQLMNVLSNKIIFGAQAMILAMGCIAILGSLVWSHHLMTVGLEADTRAYFTAATILISIPTGTKIFNWLSTYMGSHINVTHSSSFLALCFILLFTLGGTTGVVLGNAAIDISLHDTYYVVAHFHFVLSLGAIVALIAGLYFYQDCLFAFYKYYNCIFTIWCIIFLFAILLTFLPLHLLGFNEMPRRISDYADSLICINYISSIGSLLSLFSFFFLIF